MFSWSSKACLEEGLGRNLCSRGLQGLLGRRTRKELVFSWSSKAFLEEGLGRNLCSRGLARLAWKKDSEGTCVLVV